MVPLEFLGAGMVTSWAWTGTGMFWLKHWVCQATSDSRSTAEAVFEREHLQGRWTK